MGGFKIAATDQYAQILVNRILSLCKSRGISINKLSEMSGVSQSTLDNLVNGKTFNPRISTLHRIALAFSMTISEFLNFQELNDFSFEDFFDD
ncbi:MULTISPECIES: helix-turn-helix domain-containing protein [Eubacteriales]|uniref:helix-turn-helix domain-containing protein n=1 Tax=Eubacteriales TaxID=186802 RepID=UPI0022239BAE|nr:MULTISPECIES: helix-turn-helix transcriptional regulator [Eubacteriales]